MHHPLSRQTLTSVGDNATPVRSAGAAGLGRTLSANAAYGLPQSVCRFITQKTKTVVCEGLDGPTFADESPDYRTESEAAETA